MPTVLEPPCTPICFLNHEMQIVRRASGPWRGKRTARRPTLSSRPHVRAQTTGSASCWMAWTAEQKRERRAAADQHQRDDEAARKRKSRLDNPQQEHAARKKRRHAVRAAADAGDVQANAALDAAALRARERRERISDDT